MEGKEDVEGEGGAFLQRTRSSETHHMRSPSWGSVNSRPQTTKHIQEDFKTGFGLFC